MGSQSSAYIFASAGPSTGQLGNELWIAGRGLSEPRLLKEINPGLASSDPSDFTALPDGRILFVANDGTHGRELWVTDGTETGTQMVYDIGSGDGSLAPGNFTLIGDKILFTVDDGSHGNELWVTDGTTEGTKLFLDIKPGEASSNISGMTAIGAGKLLFTATTAEAGTEFWITDGTAAGTHLLVDAAEGPDSSGARVSRIFGDGVAELTSDHGTWVTDGTIEGTIKVAESGTSRNYIALGADRWLYTAYDGDEASEYSLFAIDNEGNSVKLFDPSEHPVGGKTSGEVKITTLGDGKAIIQSAHDLFVTDGTSEGTKLIHTGLTTHAQTDFVSLGDSRALFMNREGAPENYTAADLWITDGTAEGTHQIAAMSAGNPYSLPDHVQDLGDGQFAFAAPTAGHAGAVWVTDLGEGSLDRNPVINSWSGYSVFMPIAATEPPVQPPAEPHQWSDKLPLFDITYYLENNPEVAASGMDPLDHFLQFGGQEGRSPNADFDSAFYLSQYPDVANSGMNPFLHYLAYGWQEGRMASAENDFQAAHPELGSPELTAIVHGLLAQQAESQNPETGQEIPPVEQPQSPLVDAQFYYATYTDVAQAGIDPTEHYMTFGWHEGRDPDALFDTSYYLEHNADVAAAKVNPMEHYLAFGAKEGRDPSALFDTDAYLAHYADVANSGVNPLVHYLQYGMLEGREIFPV